MVNSGHFRENRNRMDLAIAVPLLSALGLIESCDRLGFVIQRSGAMTQEQNPTDSTGKLDTKISKNTSHLPQHIEEAVRAIARLRAEHQQRSTLSERLVDRATSLFGRPAFVVVLSLVVVLWGGGNLLLVHTNQFAFDAPPFPWLEDGLTLMALYMGALILTELARFV